MVTRTDDPDGLLARARAGDDVGFMELWRLHQPRLLRYLQVLNCEDADDVASETWLQVVRDLPGFSGGDDDFRRWLFTVGRHRAIDAARARQRRRTVPMIADADALADDDEIVEEQVLHALSVQRAVQLLAGLPPDQADVVALRVLAGLDTQAVAGVLGKSPGAVRVALHRGLRSLAANPALLELTSFSSGHQPAAVGGPAARPSHPGDSRLAEQVEL